MANDPSCVIGAANAITIRTALSVWESGRCERRIQSRNLHQRHGPTRQPRYSFGEAGCYLGLPESTVKSWFVGMPYGRTPHVKKMEPFLSPAVKDLLSFYDIASVYVLMALKAKGADPVIYVRLSQNSERVPDSRYPLLGRDFALFGKDVVLKKAGRLLNLSKSRQMGLRKVMDKFLLRIEFDAQLMPLRFSPLRTHEKEAKIHRD